MTFIYSSSMSLATYRARLFCYYILLSFSERLISSFLVPWFSASAKNAVYLDLFFSNSILCSCCLSPSRAYCVLFHSPGTSWKIYSPRYWVGLLGFTWIARECLLISLATSNDCRDDN